VQREHPVFMETEFLEVFPAFAEGIREQAFLEELARGSLTSAKAVAMDNRHSVPNETREGR